MEAAPVTETTIGFVQYAPVFGERDANFRVIEKLVEEGAGAQLLVMPELGTTGYEFVDAEEVARYAEPAGSGPTSQWLLALASKHNVSLVLGYPEQHEDRLYNSCMLARPDGCLFNYRKIHLFSREKELFSAGDALPPVVDTPAGRVGLMICYDWFFPELARILALGGAQILAHPANLVLAYCQKAMYARCVENHVYAITANRDGVETRAGRTMEFTGGSQILDIRGKVLASAPPFGEVVATVTIEPGAADNKRVSPQNELFEDRRPELYGPLLNPRGSQPQA